MTTCENDEFSMTSDEAETFLRDVLRIVAVDEQSRLTNPEAFVGEIARAMMYHIPFQTLKNISTPQHKRHLPSAAEIKRDMFSKFGGVCYNFGVFCWMLLRALRYKASLIPCDSKENKDDHVAVIVHDLTEARSKHLFDVGCAFPTFRAIPLDFDHVSQEYHYSYLRFRYVREGDVIQYQHKKESDSAEEKKSNGEIKDGWFTFFSLHISKPVTPAYFKGVMTRIFTEPYNGLTPFLESPRAMAYPNGRFVCIKETTLLVEDERGVVQKSYYRSRDDILDGYAHHFSHFPQDMIMAALQDKNVTLDYTKQLHKF